MVSSSVNKSCIKHLMSFYAKNEPSTYASSLALKQCTATVDIFANGPGVIAGLPFVGMLFKEYDCVVEWHITEGQIMESERVHIGSVVGFSGDLVNCEQLAIAILSRASGIASFARKLNKSLAAFSWEGKLRVSRNLTPGFGLIEEHALVLSGVVYDKNRILVRQCYARASGGIKNDLPDLVTRLKKSHPDVQLQVNGTFGEENVKGYAVPGADFISVTKLTHGYPLVNFQVTYNTESAANTDVPIKATVETLPTDQTSPPPQSSQAANEVASPAAAPAAKKPRVEADQTTTNSKPAAKQNGTSNNNKPPAAAAAAVVATTTANNAKAGAKRQRNRVQPTAQRRPQPTATVQSPNATNPRYTSPIQRAQPVSMGQMRGMQSPQTPNSIRMSAHSPMSAGRLNHSGSPGMLGNGVAPAFLGMPPTQPTQQHQQHSQGWPMMMSGGTGSMMGGVGMSMRMGGPGLVGVPNCRTCGANNPHGSPYCRNCRAPLR